jgi:hypothetical protein
MDELLLEEDQEYIVTDENEDHKSLSNIEAVVKLDNAVPKEQKDDNKSSYCLNISVEDEKDV